RVEVWADPVSGLPLQVEVRARTGDQPLITSRFLELRQTRPEAVVLTPARPAAAGFAIATGSGLFSALPPVAGPPLPDRLARRADLAGHATDRRRLRHRTAQVRRHQDPPRLRRADARGGPHRRRQPGGDPLRPGLPGQRPADVAARGPGHGSAAPPRLPAR